MNCRDYKPWSCLTDYIYRFTKQTKYFVRLSRLLSTAAYNFMVNRKELFGSTNCLAL